VALNQATSRAKKMNKNIFGRISKVICFSYLLLSASVIATYSYYSLNYKTFEKYQIKNQELITPIFLNVKGLKIIDEERRIIRQINPIGVMLYKLNFESYEQTKDLITSLKNIFPNRRLYIAIDQEGGQIDRIKQLKGQTLKSSRYYGKIAEKNLQKAKKEIYQDSKKTALIMKDLGIDINFAPMVDLIYKKQDTAEAIDSWSATNDRSYSRDPQIVIELATEFIRGMKDGKIMSTIKHIPGLGRSYKDTHDGESVVIDTKIETLRETDFAIFKALAPKVSFAMVSHATYSDIDDKPATLSTKTIAIIREEIGFKGILVSDALNMKSVNKIEHIGIEVLKSGIDIIIPNYINYYIATNVVNNIDKEILVNFNAKLKKLGLLDPKR
jgi:beta-glucosidase-like glycosyl hydrolase